MPKILMYNCKKCGDFEFMHHPSVEEDPAICPKCGNKKAKLVFSPRVDIVVNGASAANNYGLKRNGRK